MHSFYLEEAGGTGRTLPLPKDEAKHALRVLRLSAGDEVCALDGRGRRFLGRIDTDGETALVTLTEELPSNEPPVRVTLYQGLPKADKLELIVQKLTELGGAALVPVKMERSVAKSDGKDGAKRQERLERIAREAVKQCRRAQSPEVTVPLTWKQALARMGDHDLILVPWEDAHTLTMKQAFAEAPGAKDIGIVIGPEGGMSEGEVDRLREAGARAVTLGPRILRAETAAVASVTAAMLLWGDL